MSLVAYIYLETSMFIELFTNWNIFGGYPGSKYSEKGQKFPKEYQKYK